MFCKLGLGLLLSTTLLWAQPVEGPYIVVESDSAIHHIHVTARNDSIADVFWQLGNEVTRSAIRLTDGWMYAESDTLPAFAGNWVSRLYGATNGPDEWGAVVADTTPSAYRLVLYRGADTVESRIYASGWDDNQYGIIKIRGAQIWPRTPNGYIVSWSVLHGINPVGHGWSWLTYLTMSEFSTNYPYGEPLVGYRQLWGPFVQSLGPDSTIALSKRPNNPAGTIQLERISPYGDDRWQYDLECNDSAHALLVTPSGRFLYLTNNAVLEMDTAMLSCSTVGEFGSVPTFAAAVSQPAFGFAWLSQPSSGLLLNRADTSGVLVQPAGVVYWPDDGIHITGSNITLSDSGKIVIVWTTEESANPGPTQLWIEAVDWLTPLSTKPSDFIPHPSSLILSSYPNPFNNSVRISYDLPKAGEVELDIYDVLGRHVQTLLNQTVKAGTHSIVWTPDGTSGIYFIHLRAGDETRIQKLMFIK